MARFLPLLCAAYLSLQFAAAESIPGYRHEIEVVENRPVADAPEQSALLIRLKNAPPAKERIRVVYETRTGRVLHAIWTTDRDASLGLPSMGCYLRPVPSTLSSPVVILSAEGLGASDDQKITFLNILWHGTPK